MAFRHLVSATVVLGFTCLVMVSARPHLDPSEIRGYTFETYHQEFGREYDVNSREYFMRRSLFETRKADVLAHNEAVPPPSWRRTINEVGWLAVLLVHGWLVTRLMHVVPVHGLDRR